MIEFTIILFRMQLILTEYLLMFNEYMGTLIGSIKPEKTASIIIGETFTPTFFCRTPVN